MTTARPMSSPRALLSLVLLVCTTQFLPAAENESGAAVDARTRNEVLESLAVALSDRYAIPDTASKLEALVREKRARNAYAGVTSGPELARVLTEDLYTIAHDGHLSVHYSSTPLPADEPEDGDLPQEVVDEIRRQNGAITTVQVMEGNVGYLRLIGVPGPPELARPAIDAAFAFLKNTDALIIDDRVNPGGDPRTVALYVSYLSEGPSKVTNTFHWRAPPRVQEFRTIDLGPLSYGVQKPVYVLTARGTFSGGEELAYDLQAIGRATIVGEITGGGANPGGSVPLKHQFFVNMPGAQAVHPVTGTSWEGTGVKPDVLTPATTALVTAHSMALHRLRAAAGDAKRRAALDAASMKVQTVAEAESGSGVLPLDEIVGTYEAVGRAAPAVTVRLVEGWLVRHIDGRRDAKLSHLAGNRYRVEGSLDGAVTSFRRHEGRLQLLLDDPRFPLELYSR